MLFIIIVVTAGIGLISLLASLLIVKLNPGRSMITALVSVASGSLLATAFLDLLPEALENNQQIDSHVISGVVLGSIVLFFLLERVLHWHHCRCEEGGSRTFIIPKKHLAAINLIGDGIHNLIDGFLCRHFHD